MEDRIEYKVSPELAEQLALDQLALSNPKLRQVRLKLGLACAIIFSMIFLGKCPTDASKNSTITRIVAGITGFGAGFGVGFLAGSIIRSKLANRVTRQARAWQQKFGTERTVSWDSEALMISTPAMQTKLHWTVMDEILNGKIGIYGISDGRAVFQIPKSALPPTRTAGELIEIWRSYATRAPRR
jgi:hypothetical protein